VYESSANSDEKGCNPRSLTFTWMKFTAVLYPEDEGGFSVRCLEICGAISQGDTRQEALANIKEAIGLILEVRWEELCAESPRYEIHQVDVADFV